MTYNLPTTAAEALRHIHKNSRDNQYVQLRLIEPITKNVYVYSSKIADLGTPIGIDVLAAEQSGQQNVFVNLGLSTSALEHCMSGEDVCSWDVFFIDLDPATDKKPHRPKTTEEAVAFFTQDLPIQPTLISNSGSGGVHAFFSLNSPFFLANPDSLRKLQSIAKGFQDWVHHLAFEKRGWCGIDNVADPARIHRCFYTLNIKPGVNALCEPIWASDAYYDIDEVEELADRGAEYAAQRKREIEAAPIPPVGRARHADINDQIDQLWFELAQERRKRKGFGGDKEEQDPLAPNPVAILEGCGFLRDAFNHADTLSEPDWFAALTILGRTFAGDAVAHQASKPHPGYSEAATDKKLKNVLKDGAPVSCAHVETGLGFDGCLDCPFRGRINSPIALGSRTADHVAALQRYAYIAQTNEYIDLQYPFETGLDPEKFARTHGHERYFTRPDKALDADELAFKAMSRTYRPDREPGLIVDEFGITKLNWYEAPRFSAAPGDPEGFFKHLEYLIPNDEERRALIWYLAHMVQRPGAKIRWCIGLIGLQGTGKNWIAETLPKALLGFKNVNGVIGSRLGAQFDSSMAGGVLLVVDEVDISGKRDVYELLKTLISQDERGFERKKKDIELLPTPRGLIFISNHKMAFHLPKDDRRFFLIDTVDHAHPGGEEYYKKLFEMDPAFVAGVRRALEQVDLTAFNPNRLPFDSSAKARMVENSRSDLEMLVAECVDERHGPFQRDLLTFDEISRFIRDRTPVRDAFIKRLRAALAAVGATSDPLGRQVRITTGNVDYDRVRFQIVRNAERYAHMTAAELGRAYLDQLKLGRSPSEASFADVFAAPMVANDHLPEQLRHRLTNLKQSADQARDES